MSILLCQDALRRPHQQQITTADQVKRFRSCWKEMAPCRSRSPVIAGIPGMRSVVTQHEAADFLRVRALGGHLVGDAAVMHHDDAVRNLQDFVEVF